MPSEKSPTISPRRKPLKRSNRPNLLRAFGRLLRVHGHSMAPVLNPGELVVVDDDAYRTDEPQRGDIVVARPDALNGRALIKRIAGLPNERVTLDGREWHLSYDEFFLLGDRRDHSHDSRAFGPVTREELIGPIRHRVWPWKPLPGTPPSRSPLGQRFACKDLPGGCDFTASSRTKSDLQDLVFNHVRSAHPHFRLTDELKRAIRAAIREDGNVGALPSAD